MCVGFQIKWLCKTKVDIYAFTFTIGRLALFPFFEVLDQMKLKEHCEGGGLYTIKTGHYLIILRTLHVSIATTYRENHGKHRPLLCSAALTFICKLADEMHILVK